MKTEWNLGLLYKNQKDPAIQRDLENILKAYKTFEKKYKGKDFISTPQKLQKALLDFQDMSEKTYWKPWMYFALTVDIKSEDRFAVSELSRIESILNEASNTVVFFNLEISKIPKNKQKEFLNHKLLAPFAYKLKKLFDGAQYVLSEKEEQMENLFSQPAFSMWVESQSRNISSKTIIWEKEEIPLSTAMSIVPSLSQNKRREISKKINTVLVENSIFAEAEINAVYNYKKISDKLRGYKYPYSSTVIGYEQDEKEVKEFVDFITKNFSISQRFYKLHAKILGEKKINYEDRSVPIGVINKKFTFEESVRQVKESFAKADPKYANLLDEYLKNGQIDVYPKKGKRSGGYCFTYGKYPTVIMLNHTDDIRSAEVIAHEMGHAIHGESIRDLPPHYRGYSTATAEVASTFFEQLVQYDIMDKLSDDEKVIFLHNKILGDMATIFRQIACFNFELDVHTSVRESGQISAENIAKKLQINMQSYLGKSVDVSHDDGYFFVAWSHIRRFFYVYTYAYGQIVSRALYQMWKEDNSFIKKIEQFLKAGRTLSPKDTFKSIGVNINQKFFEAGLRSIEADIDLLEKLTKKWNKAK